MKKQPDAEVKTQSQSRIEATTDQPTIPVTVDNFKRAESDMYFSGIAIKDKGLGRLAHYRELFSVDDQRVVRGNRDTVYSPGVFDLDAGPVTIELPDAGKRFRSMMITNEDHYTFPAVYDAGTYTFTREQVGTRYVMIALRTLVDPNDPGDLEKVHALQDATKATQSSTGKFEIPNWDKSSQEKVRNALKVLGETISDFNGAFGTRENVDPIRHLIGSASAWGGNPPEDATYLNVTPEKNDGTSVYKLVVRDVPVNGFWSISVYNSNGYYEKNNFNAYTINNIIAKKDAEGSVTIQFGGCNGSIANCIPIMPGWNYTVRLYRPRPEILSGKWKFPEPTISK